jgi:hypothetical protein
MNNWLCLILSLPTENANARMRAWRSLKASGAAVLRDGVYLMPERADCRAALEGVAIEVREAGGSAYLLRTEEPLEAGFGALFDRTADYAALLDEIRLEAQGLTADSAAELQKKARKWRKALTGITATDFFAGEAQKQTDAALQELELAIAHALSPDEPHAATGPIGPITRLDAKAYQGRIWATRERPWVDRLACAWLVRRHIDSKATLVWLAPGKKCPKEAVGYDFDGATFSHVGARVTFEVLLASFGLETPALLRLGQLVHFLDVGGVQPSEASGIESVLAGMRAAIPDDNQLFKAACAVFDGLLQSFSRESTP